MGGVVDSIYFFIWYLGLEGRRRLDYLFRKEVWLAAPEVRAEDQPLQGRKGWGVGECL